MSRRNIHRQQPQSVPSYAVAYPSPEEIEAMVKRAQAMRAQAIADWLHRLRRLFGRRSVAPPVAAGAPLKT